MDIYVMILNVLEEIRDELREHNETLKDYVCASAPEYKTYYRNQRLPRYKKDGKEINTGIHE